MSFSDCSSASSAAPSTVHCNDEDSFNNFTSRKHLGSSFRTPQLSPRKRKRSTKKELPFEIPETPWKAALSPSDTYGEKLVGRFGTMQLADSERDEETSIMLDGEDTDTVMEDTEARPSPKRRHEDTRDRNDQGELLAPEQQVAEELSERSRPVTTQTQGRRRLKSPPPPVITAEEDKAAENKPDDEDELSSDPDVYGIAYIPTAAQRYARSQRRLQQVCFHFPGLEFYLW
jgi:hypothetical protein